MEKLSGGEPQPQPQPPLQPPLTSELDSGLLACIQDIIVNNIILHRRKEYAKLNDMQEAIKKDFAASPGLADAMFFIAIAVASDLLLDKQFLQDKYENNGED